MSNYRTRVIKNIISSILIVLIFACSFLTIINVSVYFFYTETNVRGFSMQPTININMTDPNAEGDKIYINPYSTFTNNDIVVAKVEWFDNHIVKRVVGIPGDKIEIRDEITHYGLYVNNSLFYTKEKTGENSSFVKTGTNGYYSYYLDFLKNPDFQDYVETENGHSYIQLEDNEYFLMGDNWGHTTDSITKGPVKSTEIVGKVEIIVDVTSKNPFVATWHFLKKIFS